MQQITLADGWRVYPRDDAFALVNAVPADAPTVTIPYDALWHEGQRPDAPSAGATAYFDGQVYYFARELAAPVAWQGKRVLLKLEGAFAKSFVYLNGSLVGEGSFGYASIVADLTDYLRLDAANQLLVVCKSDPHSSRWYAGTGLLRPVYLYVAEPVHAELDSVAVTTESLSEQGARLRVAADLRNIAPAAQTVDVHVSVSDAGRVLAESTCPVRVRDAYAFQTQLYVPQAKPWSAEDPQLYDVTLRVGADETRVRTGLRTQTIDPAHGLLVNGQPTLLCGACIHHDEGLLGGVSTYAYERWRLSLLKEAGFNAVRSAHNHASAELLRAADELGVYVLDEVCDMWTKMKGFGDFAQYFGHEWQHVVDSMVREDRNHPCVLGYSTGNEISDINTERGFEVAHEIYQRLRAQDPTRWVTNGVNGAFAAGDEIVDIAQDLTGEPRATFEQGDVNQFMGLMATRMAGIVTHPVVTRVLERLDASVDVQGYNYMTERYVSDAQAYPQRVMLGTETNPRRVAENWELIERLPQVIGEFTWTGWDYLGELRAPYPAWRNDAGDLSLYGLRTPVSYWREIVFGLRTAPYLAVRPPEAHGTPREFGPWRFTDALARWTWDVAPGTPMTVEVYAPGERVRLWLNGELVAEPELSEHYALVELPYAPGELVAEGADGQRHVLRTAEGPAHVVVDDYACDGWVFSRIHLEDAAGTWMWGDGRTYDCTRADLELLSAASDASLPPFADAQIQLVGQGALAIYRQA